MKDLIGFIKRAGYRQPDTTQLIWFKTVGHSVLIIRIKDGKIDLRLIFPGIDNKPLTWNTTKHEITGIKELGDLLTLENLALRTPQAYRDASSWVPELSITELFELENL